MKKSITFFLTFIFTNLFLFAQEETILINETFDDNSLNWYQADNENISCKVSGGHYVFKNKTTTSRWIFTSINDLNADEENFTIEMKIKATLGDKNLAYGMLFSLYTNGEDYQQFFVTANGQLKINHFYSKKDHLKINYLDNKSINKGLKKYNTLKVVKTGHILTYYVNDEEVYKGGSYSYFGNRIAFFTGGLMEIQVDELKITKSPRNLNLVENADKIAEKVKLSDDINSNYDELSPIISPDGKTLYINRSDHPNNLGPSDNDQDIWYATLNENGEWSALKNIGRPLNNTGKNFTVSVSPDNNSIIVANTYKSNGEPDGQGLSISYKTRNGWEVPKPIEIKDFYNDNKYVSYFVCNDNKTLIMALERKDAIGEKDFYVSFLNKNNTWSAPKHMGNVINSFGDESKPFVAADNKTLYFSSNGHPGYGAVDVFVSKRLDDTWTNWSKPKNLGPKVNTPGYEYGYFLDAKGETAYLSSAGDIYKIENAEKPDPITFVSGIVYNKKTNEPMQANIKYYDIEANIELGVATSDPITGAYKIILPSGKKYSFVAQQQEFYPISENIDLKETKEYSEFNKNLYLLPIEKGEAIRLNNIFFEFNKADLMSESFNELDRLYEILKDNPKISIEIGGHTDDQGSEQYNQKLSESRAQSVINYLIEKGINKSRLTAVGYGKAAPVVPNDSDENRAYNRRVEFKVL